MGALFFFPENKKMLEKISEKKLLTKEEHIEFKKQREYKKLVLRKYEEQNGKCVYCENRLVETGYHIDHIVPKSKGGNNNYDNLQLICPSCNSRKKNMTDEEFREFLKPFYCGIVDLKDVSEFNRVFKIFKKWEEKILQYNKLLKSELNNKNNNG
jgi:uncharacterized protein (TIGR02646 family)